jgi:hypothetical protein
MVVFGSYPIYPDEIGLQYDHLLIQWFIG